MEIDDVADGLYALPPEDFTAARDEAAKQARANGDRGLATTVKALRRPSVSAFAVNALARAHPDELEALATLGARLRDAMTGQGGDLRALTDDRRALVSRLTRAASAAAADRELTTAQETEIAATLEAATADPQLADAVRSGRLVKPLRYAGFGALPDLDDALAVAPASPGKRQPPAKQTAGSNKAVSKKSAAKPAPKTAPDTARTRRLDEARGRALDAAGAADDAQRAYDSAVASADRAAAEVDEIGKEATALRRRLTELERRLRNAESSRDRALRDREAAYKRAQTAHAEAERRRREVGRLERE
jgi:hypothetical protein